MGTAFFAAAMLLLGWNRLATRFAGTAVGIRGAGMVVQDASSNDDLGRMLTNIPAPDGPRLVLFGSSQIHAVKGDSDFSDRAIPYQLSTALRSRLPSHQVVDLSGPAQQVLESMVIALAELDHLAPAAVVVGVGLFNMSNSDVRPAIRGTVDLRAVSERLYMLDSAALPAQSRDTLLRTLAPMIPRNTDSTVQQRLDARLEHWLDGHVAMVANRRAMYNRLIDQPLRRDLVAHIQRGRGATRTARTYTIGAPYAVALAAIQALAAATRQRGIPLVVCILPTEHTRRPPPYSDSTRARVSADLRSLASRPGVVFVDLDGALGPADFGFYADSSPDGLHFKAHGHAVVGSILADSVASLLAHR